MGQGVSDPDLWWHISVGRWIIAHGSVPETELWNTFALGKSWSAYSWAPEVVFAATEASKGISGLLVLKSLLSFALVSLVAISLSSISRTWIFGTALTALAALACENYFGLRPQVISWGCFAASIAIANHFALSRDRRILFLNFIVFACWANSHLTAIFGIVGGLIWCCTHSEDRLVKTCLYFAGTAFLGTLCTPYLGGEWLTMLGKTGHPLSHIYISEFQPTNLYNAGAGLTLILIFLLGLFAHFAGRSIAVLHLISAAGLVLLGFTIQKFLPFAAIFCAASVASSWSRSHSLGLSLGDLGEGLSRAESKLQNLPPLATFGLVILCLLGTAKNIAAIDKSGLDYQRTPIRAVDYMLDKQTPLPLMNTFDDGGYLLYRYNKSRTEEIITVPIDGRTNVNDPAIVSLFLAALRGASNWREYIDKTNPGTILWKNGTALNSLLLLDAEWCQVFPEPNTKTDQWSVFVRKEYLLNNRSNFESIDCDSRVATPDMKTEFDRQGNNE